MQALVIILLILAILLVIFTLQNTMGITIHLFFWEIVNAPLALVVLTCILLGYLMASVYFLPRAWKMKKENSRLEKFNKELDELKKKKTSANLTDPQMKAEDEDPEGIELEDEDDNSFFKD